MSQYWLEGVRRLYFYTTEYSGQALFHVVVVLVPAALPLTFLKNVLPEIVASLNLIPSLPPISQYDSEKLV